MEKYFTPAEINHLIPKLEEMMEHARSLYGRIQGLGMKMLALEKDARAVPGGSPAARAAEYQTLLAQIHFLEQGLLEALAEVERLGGQAKGLEMGLVDFPGRVNGEDVLLCWHLGEKQIAYYHDVDEGYPGRKPLPVRKPTLH